MNIDKIKQIAHEKYGKDLTDEQAAKYAEKYGKLSDDELDRVSGGCSACDEEYWNGKRCETCGIWCDRDSDSRYCTNENPGTATRWKCPVCGTVYE